MSRYFSQVEAVLDATTVHSLTSFSWFGERLPAPPLAIRKNFTPHTARHYLQYHLESRLYTDFYSRGSAQPSRPQPTRWQAPAAITPFVEELSAANAGQGYWEDGWRVRAIEHERLVVQKQLELRVPRTECRVPGAAPIEEGLEVKVRFPKEFLSISPGFYTAAGDRPLDEHTAGGLIRFYWNLTRENAVAFLRETVARLTSAGIAFRLKLINDPDNFLRCDAGVVYIRRCDYGVAAEHLASVYKDVEWGLKRQVPAFVKTLAPGLGLAEGPGDGRSFGQDRCRILAHGLVRSHEQGADSMLERMRIVVERFAEEGMDLRRPYLNPRSEDTYEFGL